jgi:hypothetical protein
MPPRKYRIAKQTHGGSFANPTTFANRCLQLQEFRTSDRRISGDTANIRRKAVTKELVMRLRTIPIRCRLMLLTTTLFAFGVVAAAQAPSPSNTTARADNYYGAGNHVDITAPMPRDVVVAGRYVDIRQSVAGDILAAGWHVSLTATADDDVRMAGGTIMVNAPIKGDLTVAGGDVTVGEAAKIAGQSWISGQTIRVQGVLERELHVAGQTVQLAGEIRQPTEVVAERLEILSTARILAPLHYKGTVEATIANGAIVNGPIIFDRIKPADVDQARALPIVSSIVFIVHLMLIGLLVLQVAPKAEQSVVEAMRGKPWQSLLIGFMMFLTVPIAAILLMISILGAPLGLIIAAVYAVALFAAVLATAFFVGEAEARLFRFGPVTARGQHAMMLLAGVLTLAILRSVLGGLVVFVSVLFGLGALALWCRGVYSTRVVPGRLAV